MPPYDEPSLIPTHSSSFNSFSALPTLPESPSTSYSQNTDNLTRIIEELRITEYRYHSDLVLVKRLFYSNLKKVFDKETFSSIFLNWDELIELSAFLNTRFGEETPDIVFATDIDRLSAFVRFCSRQTTALERLQSAIERPDVRKVYNACCEQPASRGLSLSHFLLVPLGRITRYPLLMAKMVESVPEGSQLHTSLDVALQLLKALVSEVNLDIQEADNIQMLYWAQQHIRCTDLRESLEFTSAIHNVGPRIFHHSDVLYKAKSGRLLIGLLFNDILLLTTTKSDIGDPLSFKLSKSSEIKLSVYKKPLLLSKLAVERGGQDDETGIQLKYDDEIIHVRAVNRHSRTLWLSQLAEAVKATAIANAEETRKGSVLADAYPTTRLPEIVGVQHTDARPNENAVSSVLLAPQQALYSVAPPNTRGRISVTILEANLSKNYGLVRMDPYCRLRVGHFTFETPSKLSGGRNPFWNRIVYAYLPMGVNSVFVQIIDEKAFSADACIAQCHIMLPPGIFNGEAIDGLYPLSGQQGEGKEGFIHLIFSFAPVDAPVMHPAYQPQMEQAPPAVVPPTISEEDVKAVKEMFPDIDDEIIRAILEEMHGDQDAAVTTILEMAT